MWVYNQTELYHHGILGMKWGRRKESTSSVSTSSGRKSSKSMSDEELTSQVKRLSLEKTYDSLSKENRKPGSLEKTKKVLDAASSTVNQARALNRESINSSRTKEKLDLSKMTDAQLRERINRTNLERQYNDMFAKSSEVSKGQQYASKVLDVGGSVLAIGSSALGIALAIKELKGK